MARGHLALLLFVGRGLAWVSTPVARHLVCSVEADTPTICTLKGYEAQNLPIEYHLRSLPAGGKLYDISPGLGGGSHDPPKVREGYHIGPHELPFRVSDQLHRLVYVPPPGPWAPAQSWASFEYTVTTVPELFPVRKDTDVPITSERGTVVLTTDENVIATSTFDATAEGWRISGNFANSGQTSSNLHHQAIVWGRLSNFVYGVDEVHFMDQSSMSDSVKWYFEAPAIPFFASEMAAAYGGNLVFTIRSLYGDFSSLNSRLDLITMECASCKSGRGLRIIKFVDETLTWDGSEKVVEVKLLPVSRWMKDMEREVVPYVDASDCEIASVLTGISRLAILGDFTRSGEGVAIDDVKIVAGAPAEQPTYPTYCQGGCFCKYGNGSNPLCC